ncbi:12737_t:CDS:2 [Acaulospora morrowiae]|uniref:12737_t:CDS:1 n=1 Tax=Acaulospora morrowiae TaxID=94023 RepID=A0A9N8W941_9GLOM|nr:12737_t:CDS:2 [Acaulospora morrowiae]
MKKEKHLGTINIPSALSPNSSQGGASSSNASAQRRSLFLFRKFALGEHCSCIRDGDGIDDPVQDNRPRLLIVGLRRWPFIDFQVWDFPEQLDFFDPTFDTSAIFGEYEALIFVINAQVTMDSYYSGLKDPDVTLISDQNMDDYSEPVYLEEAMIIDQNTDDYSSKLEDPEENWITDRDDQEFTHDYLAATKVRSLLEDQIIENEEGDVENMLPEDEEDEKHEIPEVETKKRSPCVIFDNLNGEVKHCNSTTKLVSLSQLIGTWEIEITPEENLDITELGKKSE